MCLLNNSIKSLKMYEPTLKREIQVLAKMREMKIKSLSDSELERVFSPCVAPKLCVETAKDMINKGLAIDSVRLNYE